MKKGRKKTDKPNPPESPDNTEGAEEHETAKDRAMKGKNRKLPEIHDLGPNVPSFDDYRIKNIEFMTEVQNLLNRQLDDDPVVAAAQARDVENRYTGMRTILGFSEAYLDLAEYEALRGFPKWEYDWNNLDREKAMVAKTAKERRFRDVVVGIIVGIQRRLNFAQAQLRFFAAAEGGKVH